MFLGARKVDEACLVHVKNVMNFAILSNFFEFVRPAMLDEVRHMVFRVKAVFSEALNSSSWLTSTFRTRFMNTLDGIKVLIGSPGDRIKPEFVERFYEPLHDVPVDRLFPSWIQGRRLNTHYQWKEQKSWLYNEQSARAFFTGSTVVIPTGHVHQPIFYEYGPPALNYAGIGMTLGHEFMHAFDVGHLRKDFWEFKEVKNEYTKRALCLRRSHRSVLTAGGQEALNNTVDSENLADFVGTKLAYAAYDSLPEEDKRVKLAGFIASPDQLFFMNYCVGWCARYASLPKRYSPYRSRCIVPLMNMPEFARAFGCDAGTPMNPDNRCTFW
ncbi:neprilysin-1-like [Rhipicephalus microplus]|uniref:neprilysin-1-like n=1 Tax=Rhipicephalus microplus TaxID=6941 RepID=UPI003F6B334C